MVVLVTGLSKYLLCKWADYKKIKPHSAWYAMKDVKTEFTIASWCLLSSLSCFLAACIWFWTWLQREKKLSDHRHSLPSVLHSHTKSLVKEDMGDTDTSSLSSADKIV